MSTTHTDFPSGGGGGGATVNATANEDMLLGTPVGYGVDGNIARAKLAVSQEQTNAPAYTTNGTGLLQVTEIDTGKFACLFYDADAAPDDLVVVIATIDAATNTVTYGASNPVGASTPEGLVHDMCKLDTDKIVITYTLDGVNNGTVIVGNVSGTTVTFGAPQVLAASGNLAPSTCCQLDTDKFGFMFSTASAGNRYQGFATVSGTVVTVVDSNTTAYGGVNTTSGKLASVKIATDKFAVGSDFGYTVVFTTVGATFAAGAVSNFSMGGATFDQIGMQSIIDDTFWFLSQDTTAYATVVGTTITLEDKLNLSGTATTLTNNGTDIVYMNFSDIYTMSFSGGNVVATPLQTADFSTFLSASKGFKAAFDGARYLAIGYNKSESTAFHMSGMASNFVGALTADVLKGASTSVVVKGSATAPIAQTIVAGTTYEVTGGAYVPTVVAPSTIDYSVVGVDATTILI